MDPVSVLAVADASDIRSSRLEETTGCNDSVTEQSSCLRRRASHRITWICHHLDVPERSVMGLVLVPDCTTAFPGSAMVAPVDSPSVGGVLKSKNTALNNTLRLKT